MNHVELWGGVECTCRRVGDTYSDQLTRSGHRDRLSDLDRFAELGLRTLRYPVLWEHVAPQSLDEPDWRWPDERLPRLQALGIEPIVGLVRLRHNQEPTVLPTTSSPPLLITGSSGTLGQAFRLVCQIRGLETVCLGRAELDITNADAIDEALHHQLWAVVNAAGYVRIDAAEADAPPLLPRKHYRAYPAGGSLRGARHSVAHRLGQLQFCAPCLGGRPPRPAFCCGR